MTFRHGTCSQSYIYPWKMLRFFVFSIWLRCWYCFLKVYLVTQLFWVQLKLVKDRHSVLVLLGLLLRRIIHCWYPWTNSLFKINLQLAAEILSLIIKAIWIPCCGLSQESQIICVGNGPIWYSAVFYEIHPRRTTHKSFIIRKKYEHRLWQWIEYENKLSSLCLARQIFWT